MKILFRGEVDLPDDPNPDDRGTVDNWLAKTIEEAVTKSQQGETGLDHLRALKIRWDLEV